MIKDGNGIGHDMCFYRARHYSPLSYSIADGHGTLPEIGIEACDRNDRRSSLECPSVTGGGKRAWQYFTRRSIISRVNLNDFAAREKDLTSVGQRPITSLIMHHYHSLATLVRMENRELSQTFVTAQRELHPFPSPTQTPKCCHLDSP